MKIESRTNRRMRMVRLRGFQPNHAAWCQLVCQYSFENVISKRGLLKRIEKHPGCGEVRRNFPSADLIGRVLVFHLRRNEYRPICTYGRDVPHLYVEALLNHKDYDRKE